MSEPGLLTVDWSKIPEPVDDGGARHLQGATLPSISLLATDGTRVDPSALRGRSALYVYPLTGKPGVALPKGWDDIPGARGCTPQSCAFRDHYTEIKRAGADQVFGLSTQPSEYQREAAERLHLPFPLLSDLEFGLTRALNLPTMDVNGTLLLRRLTAIIDDGRIVKVFYPVFPPDKNAAEVLAWLNQNRSR